MLPGAFLALPGALVSGRLGDKATLLVGLALLTLGAGLLAVSPGLAPAVVARLVSGAGGTLLAMQVAKIVTDLFVGKEIATAMGITLGTFPLGIALAMATLSGLAAAASWQVAVAATAATTVLILMLVTTLYRDPPDGGRWATWSALPSGPSRLGSCVPYCWPASRSQWSTRPGSST